MNLSADVFAGLAGLILSLAFNFVPGLREWFAAKSDVVKSDVMLLCLVLAAGGIAAVSCFGLWSVITCDKPGFLNLAGIFLSALVANQSAQPITKAHLPASVKAAKARDVPGIMNTGGPVNPEVPDAKP